MAEPEDDAFSAPRGGPLEPGDTFANRYAVVRLLGMGGMGAVYEVRDDAVGETVALKILMLDVAGRSVDVLERFRREVRVARRVTHRNVARTFDLGEHGGLHFLTMELVDGESLDARLAREGRLPVDAAADIALQICEGLAAAHAAGVVHRDLKPANVLCERSGRVVLTDFGIARALVDDGAKVKTAGIVGTPAYMAPEQVSGSAVDARADLFALGVVLYELITGELPFDGDSPMAAAVARLLKAPEDPRAHVPDLPGALATLLLRCLAREPAGRPSSAKELAAELTPFALFDDSRAPRIAAPAQRGAQGPRASAARTAGPEATSDTVAVSAAAVELAATRAATPTRQSAGTSGRGIAVLPFRYRGPASEDYLGEGITEQLVDALTTTRGLRVLGAGATLRYKDQRDPRVCGRELGVDVMIDGSVQRSADQVRITARLVDVASGTQLWSERFDGVVADVFTLEDSMSQRIAEALRVELTTIGDEGTQSPEAIDLYFRGRREMRKLNVLGPEGAVALLDRCLALAPTFKLAVAAQAIASVRAWFVGTAFGDRSADWQAQAERSVARATAGAPELAETHLAAGMLATQRGDYGAAAVALTRALSIAPTYADAHEYLGSIQCEAGRPDEGMKHLRLAAELDPTMMLCLVGMARHHALHAEWSEYERVLSELATRGGTHAIYKLQLELRVCAWRGDTAGVQRALDKMPTGPATPEALKLLALIASYGVGVLPAGELMAALDRMLVSGANPRFFSAAHQAACEAFCYQGREADALICLKRADDSVLVDIEWLDWCTALEPMRATPDFQEIRRRTQARADAMWR